jgi:hypothetical protein
MVTYSTQDIFLDLRDLFIHSLTYLFRQGHLLVVQASLKFAILLP